MGTVTHDSTIEYLEKLDKLEHEFLKFKKRGTRQSSFIPVSLKGILKGVRITEKDLAAAKK